MPKYSPNALTHSHSLRYLNDVFMLEIKEGTSLQWNMPPFDGAMPSVRESHSTLTWGNKLIMYGGMNGRRLGDVWVLDVTEWKWSAVSPQGTVPLPRSLHVANIIKNRLVK